ncbi:PEGA domain-containing protein [uncultured Sphaerochaeta sp.]|uniref:PEGA domain-containing protein n=1 Tax=uncultured Sphaerochaeta sp. TaxID=886478 RepID=UPI002A0A60B7|nr:PEGA domain-containing protein [uncultured Sphaerochaeta sp.]
MFGRITRTGFMFAVVLLIGGMLSVAVQRFLVIEVIDRVGVQIEGKVKGITVGGSSALMLEPGTHTIMLEKDGYTSTSQKVNIKSGEVTNMKLDMKKP